MVTSTRAATRSLQRRQAPTQKRRFSPPSNKQMQRTRHGSDGASPLICVFGGPESHATRTISVTFATVVVAAIMAVGCGLCGNEDEVRVTSPDGKHVAHSYLRNCGATTDYVTMVDMETPGHSNGINAYSADGAHELTLRWTSPQELHIECRGCPPRHLTAPGIDGVEILVISAAPGSGVVPHL